MVLVDLFLYDIKHINDQIHQRLTGVSNKIIHDNIRLLAALGSKVIISIPLIPGYTDDDENLSGIASFILSLKPSGRSSPYPVRILPYHDLASAKYARKNLPYLYKEIELPSSRDVARSASFFSTLGIETTTGGL